MPHIAHNYEGTYMVAIVYQTDKQSGITCAYRSVSYRDKDMEQSHARRTLIGQVYKETGDIAPTGGRKRKTQVGTAPVKHGSKVAERVHRSFYVVTYLVVDRQEYRMYRSYFYTV